MTYLDELLFNDDENQNVKVDYIPLTADDDTKEPSLQDGDVLGVLPLRNMVLFPGVLLPVTVARPKSKKLVINAFKNDELLAVCCQRVQDVQEPSSDDLYSIGTAGRVMRTLDMPDGSLMVIMEGIQRIEIQEIVAQKPYMKARVHISEEEFPKRNDKEFIALVSSLKAQADKILEGIELGKVDFVEMVQRVAKSVDNALMRIIVKGIEGAYVPQGNETFGFDRYLNQQFYHLQLYKDLLS